MRDGPVKLATRIQALHTEWARKTYIMDAFRPLQSPCCRRGRWRPRAGERPAGSFGALLGTLTRRAHRGPLPSTTWRSPALGSDSTPPWAAASRFKHSPITRPQISRPRHASGPAFSHSKGRLESWCGFGESTAATFPAVALTPTPGFNAHSKSDITRMQTGVKHLQSQPVASILIVSGPAQLR